MMDESPRYGAWMAEVMGSHLHGQVLEIGCGGGLYTPHYADLPDVVHVTAIDLDAEAISQAKTSITRDDVQFLVRDARELRPEECESIVCANVVEHIEADDDFLRLLAGALRPGGTMAVLVPAHPLLYSEYDRLAGHHRRYSRKQLRVLSEQADLRVDRLFFFNFLGAAGWIYAFKMRQRAGISENQSRPMIRVFERYFLPLGRLIESILPVPFGLSLIALCTKPS